MILDKIRCFFLKHHFKGEMFPYKKNTFIVFKCIKCGKVKCSDNINRLTEEV